MSEINVTDLTFCYDNSYDNIFEHVSFQIDTDWKLGFIGRNGKGKTTFLNLLLGKYEYSGCINTNTLFDYFPYSVSKDLMHLNTIDVIEQLYPDYELWKICRELDLLKANSQILYQTYQTLSHGERTKIMLSILFSKNNYFLLIDEPTNHLDMETRDLLCKYLSSKTGFILVSHERQFMDACIDHVLVFNRNSIVIEKGNFSSWWSNKQKKDQFEENQNKKLKSEIYKLEESARHTAMWAEKVERSKIGFNPTKEHDRFLDTRAYIGEKSRRMQQRRKNLEKRQEKAILDKEGLLKDLESTSPLKLNPLSFHKDVYIRLKDFSVSYEQTTITKKVTCEIKNGERVLIKGKNGCGKSSIIKSILSSKNIVLLNSLPLEANNQNSTINGLMEVATGLRISYISQDTSYLTGSLNQYIERNFLDSSLFKAILRQLDFERLQFEKNIEDYSEGQKKKVLIATSLVSKAHLYIWDEPLNYIDVFSRIQIEEMILKYKPTMLFVEHDKVFADKIATNIITL